MSRTIIHDDFTMGVQALPPNRGKAVQIAFSDEDGAERHIFIIGVEAMAEFMPQLQEQVAAANGLVVTNDMPKGPLQ